jgi:hypothetical protein
MAKTERIDENNALNEMDCTFYFVVKSEDKTIVPEESMQKVICRKMEKIMGVRFYGMRSGPDVRSSLALKKEWEGTIPEQIDFIYIDREKEEITLLSQPQRDFVFEKVMESDTDIDTLELIETALDEFE